MSPRKWTKKEIVTIIATLRWFSLKIEQINDPYLTSLRSGQRDGLILMATKKIIGGSHPAGIKEVKDGQD